MRKIKIGIIGGSGLDNPDILKNAKELYVSTAYGEPSSALTIGKIGGVDVVMIARHGKGHHIPPSKVNNRANIQALKDAGCTHIIATTACGSLKKNIDRGDFVILDQFIDFTRHRNLTFFDSFPGKGGENAKHTPMSDPFSEELRNALIQSAKELGIKHHNKGTVITIEGPRFSTRAESKTFASWGADVINMSIAPECALANEANIPYAAIAMATDFDCLFEDMPPVKWAEILEVFGKNVNNVTKLIINTIPKIKDGSLEVKNKIKTIPHWPKQGIMFRDITSLLQDSAGLQKTVDLFYERYKDTKIDVVVGIESRGFILGAILAYRLGVGFVPIRKPGKLPRKTISEEYELEYGKDKIEMHVDSIKKGDKVLIVDDLLATGGTLKAAINLVKRLGGDVVESALIVELPDLCGRKKIGDSKIFCLVEFEGE